MNTDVNSVIRRTVAEYSDRLATRLAEVGPGVVRRCGRVLRSVLPEGVWLVAGDTNTWRVAGEAAAESLTAAGCRVERFIVESSHPVCDDAAVDAFRVAIRSYSACAAISIGSGTMTDIVKMASFREGIPVAAVATAPSMNGYASGIAAVLSDGVKTTVPCTAPVAILADTDVLASAPMDMIQSGLGDLLSKPVSNADWVVSAKLGLSRHSADAARIIEAGTELLTGIAGSLPDRNADAVGCLTASLILSGFAMSVAGDSSPASGGEHLISHYLDMTAISSGVDHDLHGRQVGVGTLASAHLHSRLQELNIDRIDVDLLCERYVPWNTYRETLKDRFGPLFRAVAPHAEAGYPDAGIYRARIDRLTSEWSGIVGAAAESLRTPESIYEELSSAGCPTTFSQIGVDRCRAFRSITHSKDIRSRYTVLHLAWELGLLGAWANDIIELLER